MTCKTNFALLDCCLASLCKKWGGMQKPVTCRQAGATHQLASCSVSKTATPPISVILDAVSTHKHSTVLHSAGTPTMSTLTQNMRSPLLWQQQSSSACIACTQSCSNCALQVSSQHALLWSVSLHFQSQRAAFAVLLVLWPDCIFFNFLPA
jgi:hypothetical protein